MSSGRWVRTGAARFGAPWCGALALVGATGPAAAVADGAPQPMVLLSIALAVAGLRCLALGVRRDGGDLRIRNILRTHRVELGDVVGLAHRRGPFGETLALRLSSGRTITITALSQDLARSDRLAGDLDSLGLAAFQRIRRY